MVTTCKDSKSVVLLQDQVQGRIKGKYFVKWVSATGLNGATMPLDVYCFITISILDNTTRIDIEPFGDLKNFSSVMTLFTYSPEKYRRY